MPTIQALLIHLWMFFFPQYVSVPFNKGASGGSPITIDTPACSNTTSSALTLTCTLTSVPAGDGEICQYGVDGTSNSFVGVTDSVNGPLRSIIGAVDTSHINIASDGFTYLSNVASGSPTVTLYGAVSGMFMSLNCFTVKNMASSNSVDGGAINQFKDQTTAATNPTSGSTQTPASNGELIVGWLTTNSATPTVGTGYTLQSGASANQQWGEYQIQTTATATNTPFTMSSDTWLNIMTGFGNTSFSTGITPISGDLVDYAGATSGSTITTGTLATGTHGLYSGTWSTTGTVAAVYDNTSGFPGALTAKWLNGTSYPASGAMTIKHVGDTAETWNYTLGATTGIGFITYGFFWKTDYSANVNSSACDMTQLGASAGAGDGITPQYFYNSGLFVRMERTPSTTVSSGVAISTNTWYFTTVKVNMTNSGNHLMSVYNATTGALVGTDTVAVSGAGSNLTNPIRASFGDQGSCESSGAHIWYGPVIISPTYVDYPLQP